MYSEEVSVKGNAVRTIIGAQGATIRKLQEEFNVKMKFLGSNDQQYVERTLEISGTPRDIDNARRRIIDIVEGRDPEFSRGATSAVPNGTSQPTRVKSVNSNESVTREEFFVPSAIAHLVLGPDSSNLKNIKESQNLSYAEPESIRVTEDGREMRQVILCGSAENVSNAIALLQRLVDSNSATNGVSPHFWPVTADTAEPPPARHNLANGRPTDQRRRDNASPRRVPEADIVALASSVKNDPATNGVSPPARDQIAKLAEQVSRMVTQHHREVENVSRRHCDGIVKVALEFAARAERDVYNENISLREQLASTRAQLEAARANTSNGSGMYAVEIADLKKQLRLKDSQLDGLLAENDQLRCNNEDMTLEVAEMKSHLQERQLISLEDGPSPTNKCKKCGVEPRNAVYIPCLHLTHCRTCADTIVSCEVCKKPVTSRLRINLE